MNKKSLLAGFIVLAIGIALVSVSSQLGYDSLIHSEPIQIMDFAFVSLIVGGLFVLAGIVLLIYGAILPDPPVHWDNNL
jgi:hypothetical protein